MKPFISVLRSINSLSLSNENTDAPVNTRIPAIYLYRLSGIKMVAKVATTKPYAIISFP